MATFQATTSDPGTLSAADKVKLDNTNVEGDIQNLDAINFIPQPASSGAVTETTEGSSSYSAKARCLYNFSKLVRSGATVSGTMYVRASVPSGSGYVRVYNVTDGQEMAAINFTETSATTKSAALTNIPPSGVKLMEIQMRKSGSGVITCVACTVDLAMVS